MYETECYMIWLQKVLGGTKTLPKALKELGSAEKIYKAVFSAKELPKCLSRVSAEKLRSFTICDAKEVYNLCLDRGFKVVYHGHEYYPDALLSIPDYPAVLFCDGDLSYLLNPHKVSVVGTREPSPTGRSIAYKAGLNLSGAGVTLVSGAAYGIDNCSHEGAMLGTGGTIAVLGCGLMSDYVKKIPYADERIRSNGVLVTEMMPYEKPTTYTFPKRNRLISGMCESVLIVECNEKSGALITAELAKKQGRKVFAVSDMLLQSGGVSSLISQGVRGITSVGEMFGNTEGLRTDSLAKSLESYGLEGRAFLIEGALSLEEYNAYKHIPPGTEGDMLSKRKRKTGRKNRAESEVQSVENNDRIQTDETSAVSSEKEQAVPRDTSMLSPDEITVLSYITEKPQYPDEITDKCGLPTDSVTVALTVLELEGFITLNTGNTVSLL